MKLSKSIPPSGKGRPATVGGSSAACWISGRQIRRFHLLAAAGQRDGALHRVLELPDVAGPCVRHQRSRRRLRDRHDGAVPLGAELLEEVAAPAEGCLPSAPAAAAGAPESRSAGRYRSSRNVPSATMRSRSALVAAITRTSTFIVCDSPTRSNSRSCSTRSSLDLQRHAHRAHFVEEERAAMRLLDPPLARADRAGERAAHVAEQLGLEQRLRDRAAVDRDEALRAARAVVMNGPRHDLFAGAGLAASPGSCSPSARRVSSSWNRSRIARLRPTMPPKL